MAKNVVGTPVVAGYLAVFWGSVAALSIFVTSNAAPLAPEIAFKEDPAFTNTKLEVKIVTPSNDPDGAAPAAEGEAGGKEGVRYYYKWYKNGQLQEGLDRASVADKLLTKGDTWKVQVTPDDGSMGSSLCSMPWRDCAEIGKNAAEKEVVIADSPARARIRFVNSSGQEVTQLSAGGSVQSKLSCSDPDEEKEKARAAEAAAKAAAASGQPAPTPPADDPNAVDPCTYEVQWINVDAPPAEGAVNPYTSPTLPSGVAKSGEIWKLIAIATKDGVPGSAVEAKIRIL